MSLTQNLVCWHFTNSWSTSVGASFCHLPKHRASADALLTRPTSAESTYNIDLIFGVRKFTAKWLNMSLTENMLDYKQENYCRGLYKME